jgi:acetone carboxylase gamma subunit
MNVKSLGKKAKEMNTMEFTCGGCGSVIEYNETDVHESGSWTRTGVEESEWNGYKYVICPVCKCSHKTADSSYTYGGR